MILDTLSAADRYAGVQAGLAEAFAFLRRSDLADLPDGRIELDGDRLYAVVAHDAGRGEQGARLEAHRRYLDVQYCLSGDERIGWRPTGECSGSDGYDSHRDLELFGGAPSSWFALPPGCLCILWPQDAHAPLAGKGTVHKVVVKLAV